MITLRQAREAKGLSVLELAVYSGTSMKSVYDWENGIRRPRFAKLRSLCEVLEVDEDDLILRPANSRSVVAAFILEAEKATTDGHGGHDEH